MLPTTPGRSVYRRTSMWSASGVSRSSPSTPTSFSTCFGPVSVPATETRGAVGEGSAQRDDVAVLLADGVGDEPDVDTALGRQHGSVDVGDLLLDDVPEQALERGEPQHGDVVLGDLPADLDVQLGGDAARERGEHPPELLRERDAGAHVLGDHPAGDVDGVGHELTCQRQPHRARHGDPGSLLRLRGGRAEVRGDDDVVELEQRAVGARLGGEDVQPGGGDPALLDSRVEGGLVDDPAAGGVDDDHAGLDLGERLGAEEADRLGRLREVDGEDVGGGEELVEADEPDAELRRTCARHVGVVGDDGHPERG